MRNPATTVDLAAVLRKVHHNIRQKKLPLFHELNVDIIKGVEFNEAN